MSVASRMGGCIDSVRNSGRAAKSIVTNGTASLVVASRHRSVDCSLQHAGSLSPAVKDSEVVETGVGAEDL